MKMKMKMKNEHENITDISYNINTINQDIKLLIENIDSSIIHDTTNNNIKSNDSQLEYNIINTCIIL